MSLSTVDDPSTISETQEASVRSRDGGMCVLCGMYNVDIAHIIARRSAENYLVDCIRQIAPSLSGFRKDNASNLICLCPTHHHEFDSGGFVFVPSERQRLSMLEYEERDFAMREESIAQGREDPGRTFPKLINEFEYIPIIPSPFRIQIHNATPHDPYTFYFDNEERQPCCLLHFQASHIALMTQAARHLPQPFRVESSKADMAWTQIISLLKLYKRQPRRYSTHVVPVPDIYQFCDGPMPGLTPSSSASTQTEDINADLYAEADSQLLGYAKEPSITSEDLKTTGRPPLSGKGPDALLVQKTSQQKTL